MFEFNSCKFILSVPFFDEADLAEFKSQFALVLKIFFLYEEQCPQYGQFSELVVQIQKTMSEDQLFEFLEINEQQLLDTEFNNKEFVPTSSKKIIKLKRRIDLKNRTLVKQLRDMFSLRRLINEIKHHYLDDDTDKITDKTAHMFRQWLAMCTQMNAMNDKVMSYDGNLLSQFMMVAKASLNDNEPLQNVLNT